MIIYRAKFDSFLFDKISLIKFLKMRQSREFEKPVKLEIAIFEETNTNIINE